MAGLYSTSTRPPRVYEHTIQQSLHLCPDAIVIRCSECVIRTFITRIRVTAAGCSRPSRESYFAFFAVKYEIHVREGQVALNSPKIQPASCLEPTNAVTVGIPQTSGENGPYSRGLARLADSAKGPQSKQSAVLSPPVGQSRCVRSGGWTARAVRSLPHSSRPPLCGPRPRATSCAVAVPSDRDRASEPERARLQAGAPASAQMRCRVSATVA